MRTLFRFLPAFRGVVGHAKGSPSGESLIEFTNLHRKDSKSKRGLNILT